MNRDTRRKVSVLSLAALVLLVAFGCHSPENGRTRGGGHGGDGGNYPPGGARPPSKLDGTRTWTAVPKT
ncbi:MAG: hypothetical protein U0835_16725 [Isosphaeraceae bacterium]